MGLPVSRGDASRSWNHAASSRLSPQSDGSTLMWKSMIEEAREVVWLASFVKASSGNQLRNDAKAPYVSYRIVVGERDA